MTVKRTFLDFAPSASCGGAQDQPWLRRSSSDSALCKHISKDESSPSGDGRESAEAHEEVDLCEVVDSASESDATDAEATRAPLMCYDHLEDQERGSDNESPPWHPTIPLRGRAASASLTVAPSQYGQVLAQFETEVSRLERENKMLRWQAQVGDLKGKGSKPGSKSAHEAGKASARAKPSSSAQHFEAGWWFQGPPGQLSYGSSAAASSSIRPGAAASSSADLPQPEQLGQAIADAGVVRRPRGRRARAARAAARRAAEAAAAKAAEEDAAEGAVVDIASASSMSAPTPVQSPAPAPAAQPTLPVQPRALPPAMAIWAGAFPQQAWATAPPPAAPARAAPVPAPPPANAPAAASTSRAGQAHGKSGRRPSADEVELRAPAPRHRNGRPHGAILPEPAKVPRQKSTAAGPRTTVMLRNMPNNYNRHMLIDLLNAEGFESQFDFLYLPVDFQSRASLGYAFVNLQDEATAHRFWDTFDGYSNWVIPSRKVSGVSWAGPHQGLQAHIERYRNSPVMADSVPDEFKPAMFERGQRVPFPTPTRKLKSPATNQRKQAEK